MKTITVLSGKGGVGKSSITASLAVTLAKKKKIICADCDVDASNLALIFGLNTEDYKEWVSLSTNKKAVFDHSKCDSCNKCKDACYFDAIKLVNGKPELKEFSCEGCGACLLACPNNAISLVDVNNAKIGYATTQYGFKIVSAQLDIGGSGSGKVVSEVKKKAKLLAQDSEILLIDSAAGIGCPVIASIAGSNYAIIVTEPTPSGISDMNRALDVINHFKIPFGIIINKHDINTEHTLIIERFAKNNAVTILAKIPYDKSFVESLVNLMPITVYDKKYRAVFEDLAEKLEKKIS